MTARSTAALLLPLLLILAAGLPAANAQEATPTETPVETAEGENDGSADADADADAEEESGPRDLESELDALRDEVDRLREEVEDRASGATSSEVRPGTGLRTSDLVRRAPGTMRLGGVATAAAVVPQDRFSQFVFPRAALFAFAPVGDRVSFAGEVTILGGGAERVDADVGAPGRGDVFLQFAAADLIAIPDALVLRGGLLAVPVGRTNLASDEGSRELLIRPAHSIYLLPSPWFDVGGGVLGGVYLGPVRVEYQAYLLSGPSAAIDARTGVRGSRQPPGADRNADKALAGRIVVRPAGGVEVGISGYTGSYSPGGARRLSVGAVDAAIDAGAFLFEAEGAYSATDGGTSTLGLAIPESMFGGSAQATWRFLPVVLGAALPAPLQGSSFGATVRYSLVDTNLDDADTTTTGNDPDAYTRRDRLGVGLSFRPVPGYVMRAEYEFRTEGGANVIDDDRAVFSATASF